MQKIFILKETIGENTERDDINKFIKDGGRIISTTPFSVAAISGYAGGNSSRFSSGSKVAGRILVVADDGKTSESNLLP